MTDGPSSLEAFTPAPVKPVVPFAALEALDVRLGTIRDVADVPKSRKLVALMVSFGDQTRTIVAGLKQERADPRELVGRQALFVVNLESRRMAGVLSEGMLFDIGYADGLHPALAIPEHPLPDGARAG
jgi:tRNA-binding protein